MRQSMVEKALQLCQGSACCQDTVTGKPIQLWSNNWGVRKMHDLLGLFDNIVTINSTDLA